MDTVKPRVGYKYKARNGQTIRILAINPGLSYPAYGINDDNISVTYSDNGQVFISGWGSPFDLVSEIGPYFPDWPHVKLLLDIIEKASAYIEKKKKDDAEVREYFERATVPVIKQFKPGLK